MKVEVLTDRRIVKQSNVLNTAKYSLSAVAVDILHVFLAQILQEDNDLRTYRIKISELEKKLGRRLNRKYLDSATDEIMSNFIKLNKDNGDIYKLNWASSCLLSKGFVEFKASEELKEFVLNLKSYFVQTNYLEIAKLKTFYAKRFYMLFSQFVNSGFYIVKLEDLKYILDLEKSSAYKEYYDFKKRVIFPALEQVNKYSNLSVSLEEIKSGRKIDRLKFMIEKKPEAKEEVKESEIVQEFIKYFKETTGSKEVMTVKIKNRIKELLNEYLIEELQYVVYYFNRKWKDIPEFSKFISLKTLLNDKFEERLIESENFIRKQTNALELLNLIINKFSDLLLIEVPGFNGVESLPIGLVEKIIFWKRDFSNEEILNGISYTVSEWKKDPKMNKYLFLSKILNRKFPERIIASKSSAVDPMEEWLNK